MEKLLRWFKSWRVARRGSRDIPTDEGLYLVRLDRGSTIRVTMPGAHVIVDGRSIGQTVPEWLHGDWVRRG